MTMTMIRGTKYGGGAGSDTLPRDGLDIVRVATAALVITLLFKVGVTALFSAAGLLLL